jgi:hypothetical protein
MALISGKVVNLVGDKKILHTALFYKALYWWIRLASPQVIEIRLFLFALVRYKKDPNCNE